VYKGYKNEDLMGKYILKYPIEASDSFVRNGHMLHMKIRKLNKNINMV